MEKATGPVEGKNPRVVPPPCAKSKIMKRLKVIILLKLKPGQIFTETR